MCGIAGIIYRDGEHEVGRDMTRMLQSMKHRGPDSTGYALYRPPTTRSSCATSSPTRTRRATSSSPTGSTGTRTVVRRLKAMDADIHDVEEETEYAFRWPSHSRTGPEGARRPIEDIPDAEVLSLGHSLEIVKDLGDAEDVADQYGLKDFTGTHAIGHVRMATESDVDISGAHPYWAYPFADVAVVHNGQLTNYFQWKRRLERSGTASSPNATPRSSPSTSPRR